MKDDAPTIHRAGEWLALKTENLQEIVVRAPTLKDLREKLLAYSGKVVLHWVPPSDWDNWVNI